jgi:hypothetical protein
MEFNGNFVKRIPITFENVKMNPEKDVDRNWFRDVFPASYGTPYSGPQSQPIVPGSTGYGEQTGIKTDGKPEDYGLTSGGQDD